MLKGAALFYVIVIALILGIITGSFILYSYYFTIYSLKYSSIEKTNLNVESGINLLLSDTVIAQKKNEYISLYGEKNDSVLLKRKGWGIFELIYCEAKCNGYISKKTALVGTPPDFQTALYLSDNQRSLSLAGDVLIKGVSYIPRTGVKRTIVEGVPYSRDQLTEGKILQSENELPSLNKQVFSDLKNRNSDLKINNNAFISPLKNSFENETMVFDFNEEISISGNFSENIFINSDTTIFVKADAVLNDVILFGKKIIFQEGFKGSLQAFATDTIIVEKNCEFFYPSALGIIPDKSVKGQLSLREGSKINGILFTDTELGASSNISIGKEALVEGVVYSSGSTDLKGKVFGAVYTKSFILLTPSSVYENYLMNTVIDITKLSLNFISGNILNKDQERSVVKWLN